MLKRALIGIIAALVLGALALPAQATIYFGRQKDACATSGTPQAYGACVHSRTDENIVQPQGLWVASIYNGYASTSVPVAAIYEIIIRASDGAWMAINDCTSGNCTNSGWASYSANPNSCSNFFYYTSMYFGDGSVLWIDTEPTVC